MAKQEAYSAFIHSGTKKKEVNEVRYKSTKKVAKKVVDVAKNIAYERLYQNLKLRKARRRQLS